MVDLEKKGRKYQQQRLINSQDQLINPSHMLNISN